MSRLLELRLRNLVLIREGRLDCEPGFGVLTGETGSGKSLCISGLRFVLGGRVEPELLCEGGSVTAVFDPADADLQVLEGLGLPDDDLLTLTREISPAGRASCRINGALVSQATLRNAGEQLAEVTVQGASHRLLRRSWQRRLLDGCGGAELQGARSAMAVANGLWRKAEAQVRITREANRRTAAELEAAGRLIAELGPLELDEGEEEELHSERLRLRHAVAIAAASAGLARATAGDDEGGAAELLDRAVLEIEALGGIDAGLAELAAEAAAAASGLRDIGLAARRHADRVEFDAGRLEHVEERLDVLARVIRRYGSVAAGRAALGDALRLRDAAAGGAELAALEAQAANARAAAASAARRLTAARTATARRLERAVEQRLRVLELPQARFRVIVDTLPDPDGIDLGEGEVRCDAEGADVIEFRLAANKGGVALPLGEGPSGGELSRLALALAAAAAPNSQPLLVLDEVDTGVGGETAARVGDLLAEIGSGRQVLAVTHRPEIAARAGWHLLAVKRERSDSVETTVTAVACDARVAEIARLMSGHATPAALARAEELLLDGERGRRRRAS